MRELDKVLDQNEKVFWEGSPGFLPFLFGGSIASTIFGLLWLIFLIPFIGFAVYNISIGSNIVGFGILLLPHFWIGIGLVFGVPIYQILVYKNTYYAITDKRVILQKGWIGRDFEMIDFDQITNTEVNIGIFDKLFGKGNTGSILISTAGTFTYIRWGMAQKPYIIRNVANPYDVFKLFKKVTYNIKTDIQYPNKFRPSDNPGYQTNYNPNKK